MARLSAVVLAVTVAASAAEQVQIRTQLPNAPAIILGCAWYPEQWPEDRWERDLELMEDAGLHMVRVGEFAWSRMEPSEGRYDLDWLDRAIAKAARHHLVIVIGTPTDAPPAWLTEKYPDTVRIDAEGRPVPHGNRRQFSYSSPHFREFARRIADQLATRFGNNPNVVGWQIGNEYSDESFDPATRRQFQEWLRAKYKTLQALNARWTTSYWSQTYDRWDEIPMVDSHGNPGLLLDYRRFVTDTWKSFQRVQLDAIRAHADARQFITTNFGGLGWTDKFDHYIVAEDLDLISWDDYVGEGHLNRDRDGFTHDLVRGWKRQNFWVMETQPGYVNWAPISNSLDRGETRMMTWEAIGHGADCVSYWQWRSALNGQEQYHGVLVGPDGEPVPVYSEIQRVGKEFTKAQQVFRGTSPHAELAILHDYESRWAIDFQPHTNRYDQLEVFLNYYRALRDQTHAPIDVVNPFAPLENYKLVVAPGLNVIGQDLADHLKQYVAAGGHLVLGPRSGMKDEFNALNPQRQPGPLVSTLGGRVEQYYALLKPVPLAGNWGQGNADIWAEFLSMSAPDTKAVMTYGPGNGWLDEHPAAIRRAVGKGSVTYIGALLESNLMRTAAKWMVDSSNIEPGLSVPEGVELCKRTNGTHAVYILINFNHSIVNVSLPRAMEDVLNDRSGVINVTVSPGGVAVLSAG